MATLTALTVSIGNSVHELRCHCDQEVFLNFMPKEKKPPFWRFYATISSFTCGTVGVLYLDDTYLKSVFCKKGLLDYCQIPRSPAFQRNPTSGF